MRKASFLLFIIVLGIDLKLYAQDRNIQRNEVYPPDMFIENGGRFINVKTSLTYLGIGPNARADGINDDSDALIRAMDWVIGQLKSFYANKGGVHFDKSYTIYLPDGIYRVTRPLVYSGERVVDYIFPELKDREGTQKLKIVGQSRENTIIKLDDNIKSFKRGANKPVLSFSKFDKGTVFNNMPATHELRNLTINTGIGNPGAIGVDFYGANLARMDNIKITGRGKIGLHIRIGSAHGYHSNIIIDGFDFGIYLEGNPESHPVFEYISLLNQTSEAIHLSTISTTLRKIYSYNSCPAVRLTKYGNLDSIALPHMVIMDSQFSHGGPDKAVFHIEQGFLFARNINVSDYGNSLEQGDSLQLRGSIDEFISGNKVCFSKKREKNGPVKSLNLPIADYPLINWEEDFSKWANVNNYPSIQDAMHSGKPVIYFPDHFHDMGTCNIPPSVKIIIGANAMINGIFDINESSQDLLSFHGIGINSGEIRQTAHRDILLESTHASNNLYDSDLKSQGTKIYVNNAHGFARFKGKTPNIRAWVRWNNNEKNDNWQITTDSGCQMVCLGLKIEKTFSVFRALGGSRLEVLGGVMNRFSRDAEPDVTGILNNNSNISISIASNGPDRDWKPLIKDIQGAITKTWMQGDFEMRGWSENFIIPLYASYDTSALKEIARSIHPIPLNIRNDAKAPSAVTIQTEMVPCKYTFKQTRNLTKAKLQTGINLKKNDEIVPIHEKFCNRMWTDRLLSKQNRIKPNFKVQNK